MKKIPSKITLGGQEAEIRNVERCNNNAVGECHLLEGYIEIADIFNKDQKQSESSKVNTFYHELTHCILQTMGENELNNNEKFVCCFASFLTEAMCNSKFEEELICKETSKLETEYTMNTMTEISEHQ